jgi:hypothetical protein
MILRLVFAFILSLGFQASASAGFNRWSIEKTDDPFTGGQKVTVDYMSSLRSGVFILCDTSDEGLLVRSIPGFANDPVLEDAKPTLAFAFDGQFLLSDVGETGSVGDNLAISQVQLKAENALKFVDAFAKAQKQIAIKNGISEGAQLLKASGSTAAGQALVECVNKQKQE